MFNALNRYLSRLDGDARPQQQRDGPGFGFQVLRNTNLELGIEPWFDFIVGINGRVIDNPDPRLFAQEVRNCAGASVALGLWSAKGQRTRVLHVPVPGDTRSLGLSLQWTPLAVASNVWHVLDVPANSPADNAGLLPYSDYVLGTPDGTLHGESGLGELVDDYIGRPLKLWVYNNEYNVTREVEIVPSRDWGGEGALGCVLGYGALHRLPPPLDEPVNAPGEMLFDVDNGGNVGAGADQFTTLAPPSDASTFVPAAAPDFLVPAQVVSPPSPAPGSVPPRSKKKDRHGHAPKRMMDDYFAEEEKKSRELDGNIAASKTPPPPPPKAAGGPPRGPPKAEESKGSDGDGGVD
ncbi:GRASP55/65 PDZ-like domain-containing protein [Annulohypoxylon maeteangense]|uniref:GRASP55/65 PDZ-like domain-containing protein n=1 Tax=Annulohypoxylon maeteangense TaxID=1927788 RepID=UPI0020088A2C|nr:GRASP55/65 PDZ-like domain-containing protein [Annulohypoxylon maeteangense]KAI0890418.1 GRASP55/65 PDZ-like domain-containing protein [Annulohypoxylon maeteangense]